MTGFARRNRVPLALGMFVVIVLAGITWLQRDRGGAGFGDPESTGSTGTRAVARVLDDHGVDVTVVRGLDGFNDARLDDGTTVVVTNPDALGASTWRDLDRRVRAADAVLVVAGLNPTVADGLGLGEEDITSARTGRVRANCDPAVPLLDGLSLTSGGEVPAVRGDGCFGDSGERRLLVDRDQHRWVLTDPLPLINAEVDRGENAAVVLRLLGQRDRVVWYVADAGDTVASDGVRLSRLLPDWLVPGLWLLGVAVLALILVRSRRLGPLVVEPIPVTIKALETTTGLGRMYERARDRTHAARLLVDGSARRLGPLLGLDERTPRADLIRATADRTGRAVADIEALLPGPEQLAARIRTDADLIELAQNLHRTEEEVRRR